MTREELLNAIATESECGPPLPKRWQEIVIAAFDYLSAHPEPGPMIPGRLSLVLPDGTRRVFDRPTPRPSPEEESRG